MAKPLQRAVIDHVYDLGVLQARLEKVLHCAKSLADRIHDVQSEVPHSVRKLNVELREAMGLS